MRLVGIEHVRIWGRFMPTYTLQYHRDRNGTAKTVKFQATTCSAALNVADREGLGRSAELYEDGEPLCTLHNVGERNLWIIRRNGSGGG